MIDRNELLRAADEAIRLLDSLTENELEQLLEQYANGPVARALRGVESSKATSRVYSHPFKSNGLPPGNYWLYTRDSRGVQRTRKVTVARDQHGELIVRYHTSATEDYLPPPHKITQLRVDDVLRPA